MKNKNHTIIIYRKVRFEIQMVCEAHQTHFNLYSPISTIYGIENIFRVYETMSNQVISYLHVTEKAEMKEIEADLQAMLDEALPF